MCEINDEEKRLQDDLPLEVRLEYITKAYHEAEKRLEALSKYAQGLEEENVALQKKLSVYDFGENDAPDKDFVKRLGNKILQLQGYIRSTFPKRVIQSKLLKKQVICLNNYIGELQKLMKENNIEYPRKEKALLTEEEIEAINNFAVRGPKENFEGDPLDVESPINK